MTTIEKMKANILEWMKSATEDDLKDAWSYIEQKTAEDEAKASLSSFLGGILAKGKA